MTVSLLGVTALLEIRLYNPRHTASSSQVHKLA